MDGRMNENLTNISVAGTWSRMDKLTKIWQTFHLLILDHGWTNEWKSDKHFSCWYLVMAGRINENLTNISVADTWSWMYEWTKIWQTFQLLILNHGWTNEQKSDKHFSCCYLVMDGRINENLTDISVADSWSWMDELTKIWQTFQLLILDHGWTN